MISSPPFSSCLGIGGVSLGSFRIGDLVIPAFGPQALPLFDLARFGVDDRDSGFDRENYTGWCSSYGERQAWVHLKTQISDTKLQFYFQAIGNEHLRMVFYVQATECMLSDGSLLQPRGLNRFEGFGTKVLFNKTIHVHAPENKIQIIPLSGSNYFWNSTFLIALDFSKSVSFFDFSYIELLLV